MNSKIKPIIWSLLLSVSVLFAERSMAAEVTDQSEAPEVTAQTPVEMKPAGKGQAAGIDVSRYNGVVDWTKVAEQGVTFAMIKTGDGKDTASHEVDIDSQFENNYEGAGENGIARGVYHVCASKTVEDAVKEAEYCLSILDGRELEYPVAYDIEMPGTFATGKENVTDMAVAFCEVIKKAGYTPMIYTSSHALSTYFDYSRISKYKIWVAQYGVDQPNANLPYFIWQYTKNGGVEGANNHLGYCDLNLSYKYIAAKKLTLNRKNITLTKGKTYQLKATLNPLSSTDKITWTSSKKSVVSVSASGKITAKKAGTAKITAKATNGATVSCTVKVN